MLWFEEPLICLWYWDAEAVERAICPVADCIFQLMAQTCSKVMLGRSCSLCWLLEMLAAENGKPCCCSLLGRFSSFHQHTYWCRSASHPLLVFLRRHFDLSCIGANPPVLA